MLKLFKVRWIPYSHKIRTIIKTLSFLSLVWTGLLGFDAKITVLSVSVCIWRVKQSPAPWYQGPLLTGCQGFPVQFLPQANSPWHHQRRTLMRGVMLATKVQPKCSMALCQNQMSWQLPHMVGYLYQEFSKWGPWTPAVVMRGSGFFPTRGSRFYEIIRPAPHHCIYFYNPRRTRDH